MAEQQIQPEGRNCAQCGVYKLADQFARRRYRSSKIVLNCWCKDCHKAYYRGAIQRDPVLVEARQRRLKEVELGVLTCTQCNTQKPISEFCARSKRDERPRSWCRDCHNADTSEKNRAVRLEVLTHYSGGRPKCACCGEETLEFLAVDHIHGGGNAHRKAIRQSSGSSMNKWLKKNNYPAGFRVLCHNCNAARGYYGYCPHQRHTDAAHS